MARRNMTALRAAIGAVTGVAEGLTQRDVLKQKQQQEQEASQIRQFQLLTQAGFRPTPLRSTMDPAALGATALETPEMPTMGSQALQSAFEQARRRDLAPQPARPGALETPVRLALDTAKTRQFERGAAMQPAQPAMQTAVPGLGRIGWQAPETDEEKQAREMQRYEAQLGVQQRVRGIEAAQEQQAKTQQAERLADLYTKTYALPDRRPLPRDMAMVAAMQGKTPIDMGFVEKAMSNQERVRLSLDMQRLNLGEREYELKRREQDRRESDSQRRREGLPVSVQGKLAGYDSGVLMVNDVRSIIKENPDAIGPVKGRLWSAVVDAADKSGVPVRAAIEGLTGEIRNQRFGGALTATEAKLAEEFLPTKKDSAVNALSKLDRLQKFLETKRQGIFMTYKQPYAPIYTESPAPASAAGTTNPYR